MVLDHASEEGAAPEIKALGQNKSLVNNLMSRLSKPKEKAAA